MQSLGREARDLHSEVRHAAPCRLNQVSPKLVQGDSRFPHLRGVRGPHSSTSRGNPVLEGFACSNFPSPPGSGSSGGPEEVEEGKDAIAEHYNRHDENSTYDSAWFYSDPAYQAFLADTIRQQFAAANGEEDKDHLQARDVILDIGCGNGTFTRLLADRCGTLGPAYGFDPFLSPESGGNFVALGVRKRVFPESGPSWGTQSGRTLRPLSRNT